MAVKEPNAPRTRGEAHSPIWTPQQHHQKIHSNSRLIKSETYVDLRRGRTEPDHETADEPPDEQH